MLNELPIHTIKPRILQQVPRSVFCKAPKLKDSSEKSRLSFISMLRKGQTKQERIVNEGRRTINLNCAAWLHSNLEFARTISLLISYKDRRGEHLVLLDESNPGGSNSVMLSCDTQLDVDGNIEYMQVCCSGVSTGQHVNVEDLHIKCNTQSANQMKMAANA